MSFTEIVELAGAILGSVGISAAIIFSLSNWLGKVWADRILEEDKAKYQRELERLKALIAKVTCPLPAVPL